MENDECTHTPWGTNNFLMVIKFSLEMEDEHSSFNKSSRTGSQLNNLCYCMTEKHSIPLLSLQWP